MSNVPTSVRGRPLIELDDVFVLYRGIGRDVAALRGLSLSVEAGERIVIHGPSGAGKSTLVKLITAMIPPNAGSARLFDRDLAALDATTRRALQGESIGIVTQHSGDDLSPELTCRQNVELQPRLRGSSRADSRRVATALLAGMGLAHLSDRRPAGLSHGELQRVGIAAALAHRPGLIVADEPTGQLDRATADMVLALLGDIAGDFGATLVVATHDEAAAGLADRVVTITDGRLSAERRRADPVARLVVDPRGWIRLPADLQPAAGPDRRMVAARSVDGVTLTAVGEDAPSRPPPSTPSGLPTGGVVSRAVDATVVIDGTVALAPSCMEVRAGEMHSVVGRSGSGKTTLLAVLAGWLAPSGGRVDIDPATTVAACPAVAVFPPEMTLLETLHLAARVRGRQPDDAAIAEVLADLGLVDLIARRTGELSGGERSRLAIARCLTSGAALMLFDEPTAQLDSATARRIVDTLDRSAAQGIAIVCATHDQVLADRSARTTHLI